ncbi:MAG TPA: hypothetical protein PKL31_03790 [Fulvivirga sp.]|nr:hypothetical protein [Fulvivirga sp.]
MKKLLQCALIFFCLPVFAQDYLNNSFVAFTIPEKDLLPENIAFNPVDNSFYIGSTRKGKVIKMGANGNQSTFIEGSTWGLWMIIGMKVDADRNALWVCSSGGDNLINYTWKDDKEGRPAGIFKFDLTSGKLLQKFVLDQRGEVHFFNDLVVARNGDVYATHMFGEHAIYKISVGSDKLEKFVQNDLIKYPNGITLADNQSILFVAHSDGLARIDIKDKKVTQLSVPEGINVARQASIDGLYYYKWSLIGIQPDVKAVTRYYLNDAGDGIKEAQVLEYNHPMLDHPTTGVMRGRDFYYIANSQFEKFNKDGTLFPNDKLYEVVVLKLNME